MRTSSGARKLAPAPRREQALLRRGGIRDSSLASRPRRAPVSFVGQDSDARLPSTPALRPLAFSSTLAEEELPSLLPKIPPRRARSPRNRPRRHERLGLPALQGWAKSRAEFGCAYAAGRGCSSPPASSA